jgi:hypothetical protein
MVDDQTVRELALALPETTEHPHWERPAFRVRQKIFATLWPLEQRLVVKLPLAVQAALLGQDPVTYRAAAGKWGQQGYTQAQYDNLTPEECDLLLRQSWQLMAPRGLGAAQEP